MGLVVVLLPQHLGALHSMESWLLAGLVVVPFVVVAAAVTVASRRDRREDAVRAAASGRGAGDGAAAQATFAERGAPGDVASTTTDTPAPQSVQQ